MNEQTKKTTKPFHLTVTDNETGNIVRELDFNAIIGAAHISEKECAGVVIAHCSPMVQAETIMAAEVTINELTQCEPMVGLALVMAKASSKSEILKPQNQEDQKPEAQE